MANETVVLTWNVANWITVMVMVIIGFLAISLAAGLWHKMGNNKNGTD